MANQEHRTTYQEVREEPQAHRWYSGSQMEPPWETHLFDSLSSNTHVENFGEVEWEPLEHYLKSPGYYSKSTHIFNQPPIDPMPWVNPLSTDKFDEVLHNDGFASEISYNSVTGLRGHSEPHNDYIDDPLAFFNKPHILFSQSSSGHHMPDERLIGSSDSDSARILQPNDHFDTSLDSQTSSREPTPHETPPQPSFSSLISPAANTIWPLEALEDSFEHINHDTLQNLQPILPISEPEQSLARSSHL